MTGSPLALRWRARHVSGMAAGVAVVLGCVTLSLLGGGALAGPVFVGGAVTFAYLLSKVNPLATVEFAMMVWLLGPLVRRVVDDATTYHDPSIVLTAAPLASLVMLPRIRELRWDRLQRATRPLLIVAAAIAFGFAVGAVRIGLRPALVALLVWGVPVTFGLQLVAVCRDADAFRRCVEKIMVWGTLLVGIYGIVQFYVVPGWDAFWMDNAPMASIGTPEPFDVRVFSTLNSPGPMATFLVAALLFLTESRHPLRMSAQVAGYTCLALSMVRTAWLACLVGIVVVLAAGRQSAKTTALVALAVVTVGMLQVSGPVATAINERIDESRDGRTDDSFVARVALHTTLIPTLIDSASGHGLGASGSASKLATDQDGLVEIDSGLLDFAYTLGLPAGVTALGALLVGGMQLARTGLRQGAVPAGLIAGAVAVFLQMAGGNTLTGIGGVTFFLLWSLAVRQILAVPAPTPAPAHHPIGGAQ